MNILTPFSFLLKKLAKIYTSKEREFSFHASSLAVGSIKVVVKPGVFHPGLFISTKILLNYLDRLHFNQESFLELGAGSGIISILAAKKGANVFASDISSIAVENIKLNALTNDVKVRVMQSDLFKDIPGRTFNYIVINPPYYNKNPKKEEEYAWFCGSNFEYFNDLFDSLPGYINSSSKVFLILSEVSDIEKIKSIGISKGFNWKTKLHRRIWGEKNFIFSLSYRETR